MSDSNNNLLFTVIPLNAPKEKIYLAVHGGGAILQILMILITIIKYLTVDTGSFEVYGFTLNPVNPEYQNSERIFIEKAMRKLANSNILKKSFRNIEDVSRTVNSLLDLIFEKHSNLTAPEFTKSLLPPTQCVYCLTPYNLLTIKKMGHINVRTLLPAYDIPPFRCHLGQSAFDEFAEQMFEKLANKFAEQMFEELINDIKS